MVHYSAAIDNGATNIQNWSNKERSPFRLSHNASAKNWEWKRSIRLVTFSMVSNIFIGPFFFNNSFSCAHSSCSTLRPPSGAAHCIRTTLLTVPSHSLSVSSAFLLASGAHANRPATSERTSLFKDSSIHSLYGPILHRVLQTVKHPYGEADPHIPSRLLALGSRSLKKYQLFPPNICPVFDE